MSVSVPVPVPVPVPAPVPVPIPVPLSMPMVARRKPRLPLSPPEPRKHSRTLLSCRASRLREGVGMWILLCCCFSWRRWPLCG